MSEQTVVADQWELSLSGTSESSALVTMDRLRAGQAVSLASAQELAQTLSQAVATTLGQVRASRYTLKQMRFSMPDGTDVSAQLSTSPQSPVTDAPSSSEPQASNESSGDLNGKAVYILTDNPETKVALFATSQEVFDRAKGEKNKRWWGMRRIGKEINEY